MKKILLFLWVVVSIKVHSQISHGGRPAFADHPELIANSASWVGPNIPLDELRAADMITDQHKDQPYRFGFEHAVSIDMIAEGSWSEHSGMRFCHLAIECPQALSISLRFDSFKLPKSAKLFISSPDAREFLGSFDYRNNKSHGRLACGIVQGDRIIIEYIAPADLDEMPQIVIGEVVHGYRPFATSPFVQDALRGPFGSSGACEVNVNCPEGADWQIEKRSVAIITEGGSGICTGALVNNTANDGTPYFLTANHCTQGSNTGNWVFYFNHESAGCNGSNGPTSDLISGADLVANNAGSDFALLLLNDTPPASYEVQYAGWDASDDESASTSAVCIHHPAGDIKKISFEDDAPYFSTGSGAAVWWIDNWELGVTEPGSSGSPLFNQEHRIIGQLFGGASACNGNQGNGQYDFYGRFGVSWNSGNTEATRLIDWLDPLNTGQLVWDGWPDGATVYAVDAGIGAINGIGANICGASFQGSFNLTNNGTQSLTSCEIHYQLNNDPEGVINWSGSLNQNQSELIQLPVMTAANGTNTLTVFVVYPTDENGLNNNSSFVFNAITTPTALISVSILFDNYPEESSWELLDDGGTVFLSAGPFASQSDGSTLTESYCVPYGCYTFVMLDDYGDGICCGIFAGDGEYSVTGPQQNVLASGAEFTFSDSTSFCVDSPAGIGLDSHAQRFHFYPNPANDFIMLSSERNIQEIVIFDARGQKVKVFQPLQNVAMIPVDGMGSGTYVVRVNYQEGHFEMQKMVIVR